MKNQETNVKEKATQVANNLNGVKGKEYTEAEVDKMITNLQSQLQQHNAMALKAQGALEVLTAMKTKDMENDSKPTN